MRPILAIITLCISVILVMCKQPELSEQSSLRHYRFADEDVSVMKLDKSLKEISGLALHPNGHLLAHDDEKGIVYELEPSTGDIVSSRDIGKNMLRDDFEGIAIAEDVTYIVASNGTLYRLRDDENEWYDYDEIPTFLTQHNDVEGLCFDTETGSLLLACKEDPGEGNAGYRAVFAYNLATGALEEKPRFLIEAADIARHTPEIKFNPSGIEYNPRAGTFYVLASHGNTLVELARDGAVLGQVNLPKEIHRQPEGITFDAAGNLYISNEADGKHPTLVRYDYLAQ